MGGISSFIVNMFVLVFVLYFMLIGGKKMEQYVNELLPFNETNTQEIVHEINMIVRSNAIGIPLLAVIQGGVAMLGYWIFDAPNILFRAFLQVCQYHTHGRYGIGMDSHSHIHGTYRQLVPSNRTGHIRFPCHLATR